VTRILVVEDNDTLAYGLRNNLEIEGYEVEVVGDGQRGYDLMLAALPDLVILDLALPGLDGFRVLREARRAGFERPILVLTARGEESDKVRGLKLGADDYVTKPFGVLELLARIEALLRRVDRHAQPAGERHVTRLGQVAIDRSAREVRRGREPASLTPKEYALLIALVDRRGAVASRGELMREVWGYEASVLSRTVDTHIAELRRKLEPEPTGAFRIVTVRKVGYRLDVTQADEGEVPRPR